MTSLKLRKTYTDYALLAEGEPVQLIDGIFVASPAPTPRHQELSTKLLRLLFELEDRGLGKAFIAPVNVYLSETETYQPDLCFIVTERLSIIGDKKNEGPSDLIMEVLSPGTAYYDLRHKMRMYEKSGVKEYWIVDPQEKTIELYENSQDGFLPVRSPENGKSVRSALYPVLMIAPEPLFEPR